MDEFLFTKTGNQDPSSVETIRKSAFLHSCVAGTSETALNGIMQKVKIGERDGEKASQATATHEHWGWGGNVIWGSPKMDQLSNKTLTELLEMGIPYNLRVCSAWNCVYVTHKNKVCNNTLKEDAARRPGSARVLHCFTVWTLSARCVAATEMGRFPRFDGTRKPGKRRHGEQILEVRFETH